MIYNFPLAFIYRQLLRFTRFSLCSLALILLTLSAVCGQPHKLNTSSQYWLSKANPKDTIQLMAKVKPGFNPSHLEYIKAKPLSHNSQLYRLSLPYSLLPSLLQNPNILQLEYQWQPVPQQKQDENASLLTGLHRVQRNLESNIPQPFAGKGVIIGIVDVGFETSHPTFFDTMGQNYRVSRYWNQMDPSGSAPNGFHYGTLYTRADQIQAQRDYSHTHGTHVAGIAGGSGFGFTGRPYSGVAYESELVFVNIAYKNDQIPEGARGDFLVANPSIIDAVAYIFAYADSVQKPAVVNLSWGMHTGPHDGSSLFDQGIDALTGAGKIYVGAAGNDGWSNLHLSHQFTKADTIKTVATERFRLSAGQENVWIDTWLNQPGNFGVSISIIDSNLNVYYKSPFVYAAQDSITTQTIFTTQDTLAFTLVCQRAFTGNGHPNILMNISHQQTENSWIMLEFTANQGTLHAWNSGQADRWTSGGFQAGPFRDRPADGFTAGDNLFTVGENGGTGKRTISVGAISAHDAYQNFKGETRFTGTGRGLLAGFSSKGTTVDGRVKPDVCAPGVEVFSAYNRDAVDPEGSEIVAKMQFMGQERLYAAASGTSMAAPFVCGVVALMLQIDPTLTPEKTASILHQSTFYSPDAGSLPNIHWGYGPLDAYLAVKNTLMPVSIKNPDILPKPMLFPNPASTHLQLTHYFDGPISYQITELSGRVLAKGIFEQNIPLQLSPGLYQFSYQSGSASGHLLFMVK